MNDISAFWEVNGFWQMIAVIALFAAMGTLAICFGPDETAGTDEGEDQP